MKLPFYTRPLFGVLATGTAVFSLRTLQDIALFPLSISDAVSMFYLPAGAILGGAVVFGWYGALGVWLSYLVLHISQGSLSGMTASVSVISPIAACSAVAMARICVWAGPSFGRRDKNLFFLLVLALYPMFNSGIHTLAFYARGDWDGVDATVSMLLGDLLGGGLGVLAIILFQIPAKDARRMTDWLDEEPA